jgi:hypothetical protein
MRKWLIGGLLLSLAIGTSAYAHVSGAFGDFLTGVKDETTTEKLKKEIQETKEEIERLAPKVEQLEKEYGKKEDVAVTKLKFYNTVGLDTFMNFIFQADSVVDVLGNQRIVENNLEAYMYQLNQLYLDYMQMKVTKESLEGHQQLLSIIQDNLAARETFMRSYGHLKPEEIAQQAAMLWVSKAGPLLDEGLLRDSVFLDQNVHQLFTRKTVDSPYRLEDRLLNQQSSLEYHFRSDHIYVHLKQEDADVILIGVITRDNKDIASLKFEAGFLNGILISNNLLNDLNGFEIKYSSLNSNSQGFYVEQTNGAIVIQAAEKGVE